MKQKITFLLLSASLAVFAQNQPQGASLTVTSAIPYQGLGETEAHTGQGEYAIYYDNVDGVLDKPIILVDGFDPNDSRGIPLIYDLLDYGTGQNLATDLRDQGFDVVILNFPNYTRSGSGELIRGGADYIQRNAFVLVELLNMINGMKSGDEQNVVIGPSMGGLISRYALRYMEMNDMDHETRLYISFDSPHKGANVPIGFQHLFNFMANGPLADETLQDVVNTMLSSPASRQMLIDHFEGHLQAGDPTEFDNSVLLPTGAPNIRNAFQSELDAMGFPQASRNIAIVNGSGNGTANGTPGMEVINHEFYLDDSQRALVELNFTPAAGQTAQVSRVRGQINIFVWITLFESIATSQAPATSAGLDTAPGGRFDISSFATVGQDNELLTEFFDNLNVNHFSFIPTLSALGVSNTNWYASAGDASSTPFDAIHVPSENENHVTLTPANLAFALDEILNPLSTPEQLANAVRVQNPVNDRIFIYATLPMTDAEISVVDLSGKLVARSFAYELHGAHEIPVSIQSGIYFLKISSAKGTLVKKLIRN